MKLVSKYTLLLAVAITVAVTPLALVRIKLTRSELVSDMWRDHAVIGHVLVAGLTDTWNDAGDDTERATRETLALLEKSSHAVGTTQFEWHPEERAAAPSRTVEGGAFVSRFPVTAGSKVVGTIEAREDSSAIDDVVRLHLWITIAGVLAIVVVCLLMSFAMGRWLVGRPVSLLVEQARRIGRRELSSTLPFERRDELGELALEMRAASNALAESLAKTEAESEARLRAVEQMRHSDRLATVGQLAAGVAHELGTPLSIVGGHAQMIAGGEVTGDAALKSARSIDLEVTRMGKIVRQLLDFARRKGPEGTTCDASDIAQRSASLLAVMAERSGVRVTVHAASPARVTIDEDSLQQVMANLIVNAIQAMPRGGSVDVDVSRALAARESSERLSSRIRIDVRDTGPGIPEHIQRHLFEPFVTTKQPGDGTGLGLAVVHGIVVDHQGWIAVETSKRGTTFSLFLEEAT